MSSSHQIHRIYMVMASSTTPLHSDADHMFFYHIHNDNTVVITVRDATRSEPLEPVKFPRRGVGEGVVVVLLVEFVVEDVVVATDVVVGYVWFKPVRIAVDVPTDVVVGCVVFEVVIPVVVGTVVFEVVIPDDIPVDGNPVVVGVVVLVELFSVQLSSGASEIVNHKKLEVCLTHVGAQTKKGIGSLKLVVRVCSQGAHS